MSQFSFGCLPFFLLIFLPWWSNRHLISLFLLRFPIFAWFSETSCMMNEGRSRITSYLSPCRKMDAKKEKRKKEWFDLVRLVHNCVWNCFRIEFRDGSLLSDLFVVLCSVHCVLFSPRLSNRSNNGKEKKWKSKKEKLKVHVMPVVLSLSVVRSRWKRTMNAYARLYCRPPVTTATSALLFALPFFFLLYARIFK